MRPVEFGEPLAVGTRLTLFSYDKPDRLFSVVKFWVDQTLGASLALGSGVPCHQGFDRALHIGIYLFRALHNDPGVKFPFFDCINVRRVVRNEIR
jgi:hypothetical protein